MLQPEPDTMMLSAVEQGGVCLKPMHRLPSCCTPWQIQTAQTQIQIEHQALKELKLSAQVNYPVVSGNYGELKPLNNIAHHFTVERVKAAAKLLKKDTSPGLDGQTFEEWERTVDLEDLVHVVRSGKYQPLSNRWTSIRKDEHSRRTLGIPIIQDRVVQRAWLLVMEQVFERMFLPCSYGYRPDRNCHQALSGIAQEINAHESVWVLDADFQAYFDSVPHDHLMAFIKKYITDPVFLEFCERTLLVSKKPNDMDDNVCKGVPQGGVISPLYANLFAHEVLDLFFESEIRPRLDGWSRLFRYADDFVVLTESSEDAKRALEMIRERVMQYGLTLHPTKTTLVNMSNPGAHNPVDEHDRRELVFLGYELSRHQTAMGKWEVVGRTAPGRRQKALERWRQHLEKMRKEFCAGRHGSLRGTMSIEFQDKLNRSIWFHVMGFGSYYCAEGNQTEIILYEEAVLRDAAAFWERHIDSKGPNPYRGSRERIWTSIRMRSICNLSGPEHNFPTKENPSGMEAG